MNKTMNDSALAFDVTPKTPKTRFLASLSDGRTVIQDDRKNQKSAWLRLAEWLKQNSDISITGIRLQGLKGIDKAMPANQRGYFFGNKHFAVYGGTQGNYIGIGYYDGQKVNIVWYKQPNFDHTETEERTAGKAGFFLIQNS